MYRWVDAERTAIATADGLTTIQAVVGNRHYDSLVASGVEIDAYAPPQLVASDYDAAVTAYIDAVSRQRGFDNNRDAASYAGSTVALWAAEAGAFVAWRDAVWSYAYAEMAKVQGGTRAQPTVAELVAELPVVVWP